MSANPLARSSKDIEAMGGIGTEWRTNSVVCFGAGNVVRVYKLCREEEDKTCTLNQKIAASNISLRIIHIQQVYPYCLQHICHEKWQLLRPFTKYFIFDLFYRDLHPDQSTCLPWLDLYN
jgi:hypothetical protein